MRIRCQRKSGEKNFARILRELLKLKKTFLTQYGKQFYLFENQTGLSSDR